MRRANRRGSRGTQRDHLAGTVRCRWDPLPLLSTRGRRHTNPRAVHQHPVSLLLSSYNIGQDNRKGGRDQDTWLPSCAATHLRRGRNAPFFPGRHRDVGVATDEGFLVRREPRVREADRDTKRTDLPGYRKERARSLPPNRKRSFERRKGGKRFEGIPTAQLLVRYVNDAEEWLP